MRLSRSILIVFLLASLTACGFHLRGSISLPQPLISMQLIAEDLDTRQKTELERQLIRADASLEDNQAENAVRLRVSIRVLPERRLADAAGSGSKVIIRLLRELSYSLSTAMGELLIDQTTILRHHDIGHRCHHEMPSILQMCFHRFFHQSPDKVFRLLLRMSLLRQT